MSGNRKSHRREGDRRDQQLPEPGARIERAARYALPETVSVALEEIAAYMQERLLALEVGTGLQIMQKLMEADVAAVCEPKGSWTWSR